MVGVLVLLNNFFHDRSVAQHGLLTSLLDGDAWAAWRAAARARGARGRVVKLPPRVTPSPRTA